VSEPACFCADHSGTQFYGDDPGRIADLEIIEDNARFPATLRVRCRLCGALWLVHQIPYGGIYGDFLWLRQG
jgi:hypothetical protein